MQSSRMARDWLPRLLVSGNQIRCDGRNDSIFHTRAGSRTLRSPSDRRGPHIRIQGPRGRLPDWHLSRSEPCSCGSCNRSWSNSFLSIHCLARFWRREEGPLCLKSFQTVQALEQRVGTNGVRLRICTQPTRRGSSSVNGHREGISTLATCPKYTGLVSIQVPRSLLSLCCLALRLGKISDVVYAAHGVEAQVRAVPRDWCRAVRPAVGDQVVFTTKRTQTPPG